jgi:hypothetical protein
MTGIKLIKSSFPTCHYLIYVTGITRVAACQHFNTAIPYIAVDKERNMLNKLLLRTGQV